MLVGELDRAADRGQQRGRPRRRAGGLRPAAAPASCPRRTSSRSKAGPRAHRPSRPARCGGGRAAPPPRPRRGSGRGRCGGAESPCEHPLQGHDPAEPLLPGAIDHAHPAPAEFLEQLALAEDGWCGGRPRGAGVSPRRDQMTVSALAGGFAISSAIQAVAQSSRSSPARSGCRRATASMSGGRPLPQLVGQLLEQRGEQRLGRPRRRSGVPDGLMCVPSHRGRSRRGRRGAGARRGGVACRPPAR